MTLPVPPRLDPQSWSNTGRYRRAWPKEYTHYIRIIRRDCDETDCKVDRPLHGRSSAYLGVAWLTRIQHREKLNPRVSGSSRFCEPLGGLACVIGATEGIQTLFNGSWTRTRKVLENPFADRKPGIPERSETWGPTGRTAHRMHEHIWEGSPAAGTDGRGRSGDGTNRSLVCGTE